MRPELPSFKSRLWRTEAPPSPNTTDGLAAHCRFWDYCEYLTANEHRFDWVFMSDVRDVFFRASPFPLAQAYFSHYEVCGLTCAECKDFTAACAARIVERR